MRRDRLTTRRRAEGALRHRADADDSTKPLPGQQTPNLGRQHQRSCRASETAGLPTLATLQKPLDEMIEMDEPQAYRPTLRLLLRSAAATPRVMLLDQRKNKRMRIEPAARSSFSADQ